MLLQSFIPIYSRKLEYNTLDFYPFNHSHNERQNRFIISPIACPSSIQPDSGGVATRLTTYTPAVHNFSPIYGVRHSTREYPVMSIEYCMYFLTALSRGLSLNLVTQGTKSSGMTFELSNNVQIVHALQQSSALLSLFMAFI